MINKLGLTALIAGVAVALTGVFYDVVVLHVDSSSPHAHTRIVFAGVALAIAGFAACVLSFIWEQ